MDTVQFFVMIVLLTVAPSPILPVSQSVLRLPSIPASPDKFFIKIIDLFYTEDHKIVLKWDALGEGYRYQVLFAFDPQDVGELCPIPDAPYVRTPGAVVDIPWAKNREAYLSVVWIDPDGHISQPAPMVKVELNRMNAHYTVKPLS